jgi:hypothetical protein
MKKRKRLEKRIQKLRERLAKGTKKLAKLTSKLNLVAVTGEGAAKKVLPSTAPATRSSPTEKQTPPEQKKKMTVSPERRAQLAASMKARWAAKRASFAHAAQSEA